MASQLYLNNFDTQFTVAVKDVPTTGTPETELDYGILRVPTGAASVLGTLTGGDYYILTAYKRSGTVESSIEIMKVTDIDSSVINETRLTVERAQEGTIAQAYVPGDYLSLRFTKGGAQNFLQASANLADVDAATARTNLGLGTAAVEAAGTFALSALVLTAGTGLTGGGSLAANRTFALANTAVTAAAYGSATASPTFTVDAQGRLTAAANVTITPAFSSLTGLPSTLAGYGITDATPFSHVGSGGAQHANATTSVAGFMSGADKTKLDGVATGATANTGTVTTLSVVSANGFTGSVANASTTPAITITTSVTGITKGNGTALSAAVAGTDYVAPGAITGSGLTISTARLLGRTTAGTGAVEEITVGSGLSLSGGVLASTGGSGTVTSVAVSVPSFLSVSGSPVTTTGTIAISLSGTALPAPNGGTGQTSYAVGDLLYASTTSALSKLAGVATGNALISGGVNTAPSWGKIGLTTHVSGTLPLANGGTNATDAATARTNLGLGTSATVNTGTSGATIPLLNGVNTWSGVQTFSADIAFTGNGRRINGLFSSSTAQADRTMFQSSTANGSTDLTVLPNGTSNRAGFGALNANDTTNHAFVTLLALSTDMRLWSGKAGTGTLLPLTVYTDNSVRATFGTAGGLDLATGLREARTTMGANDIDLRTGNIFTKTISGTTTLTVSNTPAGGTAASFILDLTNGGSAAITWWSGMKWAAGTAPTLTAAGRDVLGFFTHDGGTTWTGLLLGKDVK